MRACLLVPLGVFACVGEEARHKAAGNVLFRRGDIDGALREYSAAVKQNPRDPAAQVLHGNALFEQERYDDASAAFARAVALLPEAIAAHRGLARVALRQGRAADAERHYGDLLAHASGDADALRETAALRAGRGDLAGAEDLLQRARAAVANDVRTLFALALVQARRGDTDAALGTAVDLDRIEPRRGFGPYARAAALALAGRVEPALDALAEAVRRGVDDRAKVESDPDLAVLRAHPRFREILAPPTPSGGGR